MWKSPFAVFFLFVTAAAARSEESSAASKRLRVGVVQMALGRS
jgi:hypothetical protein